MQGSKLQYLCDDLVLVAWGYLLPPNWLEYHVSIYLLTKCFVHLQYQARVISKAQSWFQILIQILIQNL